MTVRRVFAGIAGIVIVWISVLAIFAYTKERAKENECIVNLRTMGLMMKMYANEAYGERYPPLESQKGSFIFDISLIKPEHFADTTIAFCPTCKAEPPIQGIVNDDCYWYLGYALPDEEHGLAFLELYRNIERVEDLPSDPDADVEEGRILSLREGIERFFITTTGDANASARVQGQMPIMIERPETHGNGGHVLYMDGHVEFLKYPGKYPMTEAFIEGLRRIEAENE